jgi:hypothetical protein
MSYYYNYYLGVKDKDGKIKPLGPYDVDGKLHAIIEKSRSYASDLYEDFYMIKKEQITDKLRDEFGYEDYNGIKCIHVKYLPLKELPKGKYIKTNYYLIKDIEAYYENGESAWDLDIFYDYIPENMYYRMIENDWKPEKDTEGYYIGHEELSHYTYFTYPDYESKEYECHCIRMAANMFDPYDLGLNDGEEIVVLETEG